MCCVALGRTIGQSATDKLTEMLTTTYCQPTFLLAIWRSVQSFQGFIACRKRDDELCHKSIHHLGAPRLYGNHTDRQSDSLEQSSGHGGIGIQVAIVRLERLMLVFSGASPTSASRLPLQRLLDRRMLSA